MYATARQQSAAYLNCEADDFLKPVNRIVISDGSNRYRNLPFVCEMVSYGTNVVASTRLEYEEAVGEYLSGLLPHSALEFPHLLKLGQLLGGANVCDQAIFFLPDLTQLAPRPCPFETRILSHEDFAPLYLPEWHNALSFKRRELDVLGVGAYVGDQLVGLAACSADYPNMWQIGIDVLPEYRQRGVASALTSRLAVEILHEGKVPFYCSAWSNVRSIRNAIRSGFRPAWTAVSLTAVEASK